MFDLDRVIEGCRNGDSSMQRALYERYSARFYALCRRYSNNDEEARDILSEGFIAVFESIGDYRGEGSFEGWMHTIFLRKAAFSYCQRQRVPEVYSLRDVENGASVNDNTDFKIDVQEALVDVLRQLSDRERCVINMVAIEEYSLREAAKLMQQPYNTVRSQYQRARERMRRLLRQRLGRNYLEN